MINVPRQFRARKFFRVRKIFRTQVFAGFAVFTLFKITVSKVAFSFKVAR